MAFNIREKLANLNTPRAEKEPRRGGLLNQVARNIQARSGDHMSEPVRGGLLNKVAPQIRQKPQVLPVSGMKSGGKVSSASKRGDGCAIKGKTKGKMV